MSTAIRVEFTQAQMIAATPLGKALAELHPYSPVPDYILLAAGYWTERGAILNNSLRPLPRRFPVYLSRRLAAQMLRAARRNARGSVTQAARAAERALSDALTF